jgi:hypothetical protein
MYHAQQAGKSTKSVFRKYNKTIRSRKANKEIHLGRILMVQYFIHQEGKWGKQRHSETISAEKNDISRIHVQKIAVNDEIATYCKISVNFNLSTPSPLLQSVAVSAPPPSGGAASQIVYSAQAVSVINLTAFRIGPRLCTWGAWKDKAR